MSTERFRPSVTVAAIALHDGRFLLVEEETPEGLRLNNPAGHLDCGESLLQGVVREALEETARVFTPEALLGVYMSRFTRPGLAPKTPVASATRVRARGGTQSPGGGPATTEGDEDVTYVRFAFCGSVGDAEPGRALDDGIVRTLWMTPEEIRASRARHRSPLVLRCVEDHLAGIRHPLELLTADASIFTPEIKQPRPDKDHAA